MKSIGIELIAKEREKQIFEKGYTFGSDAQHNDQSLLGAAVCYAEKTLMPGQKTVYNWPWSRESFKPTSDIRNLVKAGALIAAEIDRLSTDENPDYMGDTEPNGEGFVDLPG